MAGRLRVLCLLCCAALLPIGVTCQRAAPVVKAPPPAPTRALTLCDGKAKSPVAVSDAEVNASFRTFSEGWISKLRRAGASASSRRRIPDSLETELRPTGSKAAPYVGILRYCEQTLSCAGAGTAETCQPSKSTLVTEIFRFQAGQWVY